MSLTELEPTDVGTDMPPLMAHIVDAARSAREGVHWALCGARLMGFDADSNDCVVCEELWGAKKRPDPEELLFP